MTYSELIKQNGACSTEKALEQRARRMAKRKAMSVIKISDRSRWASSYGPYMISTDYNNAVVWSGLKSIEEVIDHLAEAEAK